jgi:hypothetical protein
MINLTTEVKRRAGMIGERWNAFWFGPELAYTLGIVRIAFGGLLVVWTLWMYQGLNAALGPRGVVPNPPSRPLMWGVFHVFQTEQALLVGWAVLLASAIALMVGWHSRIAAILVFVLIFSLERRDPAIFNGGDALLRIEALFLALAPCGAALSLDQRRRSGSFFSAQQIRPWALRLLQIQLSIVYLSTVVVKLSGETWHNGTAVLYSLNQTDIQTIHLPAFLAHNLLISNALSWGTLVIEVALGTLVWNRRWRPWVLGAGVMLHLSIEMVLQVGFFTFVTFILYLAFIPPERAEMIAKGAQKRLAALVSRIRRGSDEDVQRAPHEPDVEALDDSHHHRDVPTGWPAPADMSPDPSEPTPDGVSPERISEALEAANVRRKDTVTRAHHLATAPPSGRHRPPQVSTDETTTTERRGSSRHAMR